MNISKRTMRMACLGRWNDAYEHQPMRNFYSAQPKTKGLFYSKAGKGIEKTPHSKAGNHSMWNWYHGMKGSEMLNKGIHRERSKSETAMREGRIPCRHMACITLSHY